jgi:hypothetical protein
MKRSIQTGDGPVQHHRVARWLLVDVFGAQAAGIMIDTWCPAARCGDGAGWYSILGP